MASAPVHRIIPLSVVDGPGNRTAIFLQGCNISCAYCHNPETQALESPEAVIRTVDEVMQEVVTNIPFIRGITISGGECMLHTEFLTELAKAAQALGLSVLLDSNGTVDFSRYPELTDAVDGVMLDVKSWNDDTYHALTGGHNEVVKKNISYLAAKRKLEEIRVVCLEGEVDVNEVLKGITQLIPDYYRSIRLKLIRFRPHGVAGRLADKPQPSEEEMAAWKGVAEMLGYRDIITK